MILILLPNEKQELLASNIEDYFTRKTPEIMAIFQNTIDEAMAKEMVIAMRDNPLDYATAAAEYAKVKTTLPPTSNTIQLQQMIEENAVKEMLIAMKNNPEEFDKVANEFAATKAILDPIKDSGGIKLPPVTETPINP